jgi:hypothetical protein
MIIKNAFHATMLTALSVLLQIQQILNTALNASLVNLACLTAEEWD